MQNDHEPTIGFEVWPVLLTLEGPTALVGVVLTLIYNDPRIDRDHWHCQHDFPSRMDFAASLRHGGKVPRRLGLGAKTAEIATYIQGRAEACGLKCVIFRGMTTPSKTTV